MRATRSYPVPAYGSAFSLDLPREAEFLCATSIMNDARLWFALDTRGPVVRRQFFRAASEQEIPPRRDEVTKRRTDYLDTYVADNRGVFHIFEIEIPE
jgi:hypothetical protein